MQDDDDSIDTSDIPEAGEEFFRNARYTPPKRAITWLAKPEIELIRQGGCPDCLDQGTLVWGPRGAGMVNMACSNCGGEFNVGGLSSDPARFIVGHRNSVKGQPDAERLRDVFGIELPAFKRDPQCP